MKKITFLAVFLMMSVISFGQTELIQDQDFSDGIATATDCNTFTGPLTGTESSWWRCGLVNVVGSELEYPTDKGPNVRQRISLEADSYYEVSFAIRSDVDGVAGGKAFIASFRGESDVATSLVSCFNIGTPETLEQNFTVQSEDFTTTAKTYKFGFYSSEAQDVIINLIRPAATDTNPAQLVYLSNVSMIKKNTLSVQDLVEFNFSLSPNPTKNMLNLSAQKAINNVELYNVLGKQVFSQKVEAKQANISVAHLSKGIYIAKVTIGNSTGSYKFIKE
jgi:hypothetical protein